MINIQVVNVYNFPEPLRRSKTLKGVENLFLFIGRSPSLPAVKRLWKTVDIKDYSVLGNPFFVNAKNPRPKAVNDYRSWLREETAGINSSLRTERDNLFYYINSLKASINVFLLCFCAPMVCHGDVILEHFNDYFTKEGAYLKWNPQEKLLTIIKLLDQLSWKK